jgi:hypothetical protein
MLQRSSPDAIIIRQKLLEALAGSLRYPEEGRSVLLQRFNKYLGTHQTTS